MNSERVVPLVAAALGVVVAGAGLAAADGLAAAGAVVAGAVAFGAGYVWYRRQWDRADEIRVDERIEQVASRSGALAFRVSLGLAVAVFLATETDGVPVTAREGLVLLILAMVVARFGLYGWYRRQSA